MKNLFNPLQIKNIKIKNRICVPPMVTVFSPKDSGAVTEETVEHYKTLAQGGPGLIIQEATCVNKDGRLMDRQLGIWDDTQIEGLKKISDSVHDEGCPIFVQIHHAGVVGISKDPMCPSDYSYINNSGIKITGHEMTLTEIHSIQKDFIEAGRRAFEAGYDGVELHGCHQYLISQFFNCRVNKRRDEYGVHPEKFTVEIVDGIRKITSDDFIIGIRLGGFEPTLEDGLNHAKILESCGIDFLDISYGFQMEHSPYVPTNYPFKDTIYAAEKIKESVSIPVFAIGDIVSPEIAEAILENVKIDMVDVGRGSLINPNWANDALNSEETGKCLHCKACKRFTGGKCPGKILFDRQHSAS